MTRSQAWCLGFFGALTFYWGAATFGGGFDWVREFRLLRHAAQVEGVVTSREPENHNLAHYRFNANGKQYVGAGRGGGTVGEAVNVFYLPDDPTFSRLDEPGYDLAFMIVAPLVLSTLSGFSVRARAGKKSHSDSSGQG